jgi:hypothetical protein
MRSGLRRVQEVLRREIAGEVFLVPIRGKLADLQRLYVLDPVGDCIWEHLDGTSSREEMVSVIVDRFCVEPEEAAADLDGFIEELWEAGLLEEQK